MKKLIFVLTLLFAFTINANAQEKRTSVEENATKETAMITQTAGLTKTQSEDLYRLFEMKYRTLEDPSLSVERKEEFLKIVMLKIQASLNEEQMKKLEADTALMDRIKHGVKSK